MTEPSKSEDVGAADPELARALQDADVPAIRRRLLASAVGIAAEYQNTSANACARATPC